VRQLLLLNPVRAIADVDAVPVPILPEVSPITGRPLDLSRSMLRCSSPIHLEYLRNMGVRSSLTISIVVEGRLWGMVGCHGADPYRVDHTIHSICELLSEKLALQVALRLRGIALQSQQTFRKAFDRHLAELESSKALVDPAHTPMPALFELLDADAQVSLIDGVLSSRGSSLESSLLLSVMDALRSHGRP
jgi:light-regulated signal transduction histidine kinase (bacteriophytochrome)